MEPPSNRNERRRQMRRGAAAGGRPGGLPPAHQAVLLLRQGLDLHRGGRLAEAVDLYRRAIALDPRNPDGPTLLGSALAGLGRNDEAVDCLLKALAIDPANARAHNNLGIVYRGKGMGLKATDSFRQALALDPRLIEAHVNLGNLLADGGDTEGARAAYERAVALDPANPLAHFNLANLLSALNKPELAESHYRRAIALKPDHAEALNGLGNLLKNWNREADALPFLERAVALRPDYTDALRNLARALRNLGRFDEALAVYRKAAAADPDDLRARWAALTALPILYDSEDEIAAHRARWAAGLATFETLPLDSPEAIGRAGALLTGQTNFNLHYQGMNDRALQDRYGALLHRIAAAAYPAFTRPIAKRPARPRLKVGFLSCHLYSHTVPVLFGGWMRHLDHQAFEVHAFAIGPASDATTEEIRSSVDAFHGNVLDNGEMLQAIRDQALDALIFTDIGMDPRTNLPAALRLAPVQCATWGHPVTSGLPTIDYFLTSDLMEPEGGEDHYSETLVRLPNLSVCFRFPPEASLDASTKPAGPPVYLCSQSLFKMLPRYDGLYARIARAVGACRFVFIRHPADLVTEQFQRRLKRAFAVHGLDADDYCEFRPRLAPAGFFALNREADVVLDSLVWSGGRTSLEAAACDKPIVTLPGEMMRGRHTAGILTRLGIPETIAGNEDDYVAIAARLGTDPTWRDGIVVKVKAAKHRLYDDLEPVRALEDFLQRVCRSD